MMNNKKPKQRLITSASILFVLSGLQAPLLGDTITYTGASGGDYETGSNWDTTNVPADDLSTDIANLNGINVDLSGTRQVSGLDFGTGADLTGTGSIEIGNDGIALSGDSNIDIDSLVLNQATSITLDGDLAISSVLTGTGDLTVAAGTASKLTMTGVNGTDNASGYSGAIVFDGIDATVSRYAIGGGGAGNTLSLLNGTILRANGEHLVLGNRNIVISGGATIQQAGGRNVYRYTGVVSGDGGLTYSNAGTGGVIQLEGTSNSYLGGTTFQEGAVVNVEADGSLGDSSGGLTFDDGTFSAQNSMDLGTRSITVNSGGGTIDLNGKTVTVGGALSGAGELTFSNGGIVKITSVSGNSFTGGTVIDGSSVEVRNQAQGFLGTGTITLDGGTIYGAAGHVNMRDTTAIVVEAGGAIFQNAHTKSFYGLENATVSGDGVLILDGGGSTNANSRIQIGGMTNNLTAGLVMQNAANVQVSNDSDLGAAGSKVTLDNARFVSTDGGNYGTREFEIASGGGTLSLDGATTTLGGPLTGTGALLVDGTQRNNGSSNIGGTLALHSTGTLAGDVTLDGVNILMSSSNVFGTGEITLQNGSQLKNNGNNTNPVLSNDLVIGTGGGELMAGWSNGSVTINGVVSGVEDLTIQGDSGWVNLNNTGNTFSGDIVMTNVYGDAKLKVASLGGGNYAGNISGLGELEYSGSGTQTFSGLHSYSGATTISDGSVILDYSTNDTSKLSDTAALSLGGTLDLNGGTHVEVVGSTELIANTASSITQTGGSSTIQLNTIVAGSGATIDFQDGIATTDNALTNGILGGWATVDGTDFATLATTTGDNDSIVAYTGYTDLERLDGSGAQMIADDSTSQVRLVEGTGSAQNITVASGATIDTLNQSSSGGSSLGTVDVGAANSLALNAILVGTGSGGLTIDNGTLKSAATELIIAANDTTIVNSEIADGTAASSLVKVGSSTLTLNGDATYTGDTIVNAGTLEINGAVASDNFTMQSGSTLDFDTSAGNVVLDGGTITGDGTFVKSGSNDLILGANKSTQSMSMTGGLIDVQQGTLRNDYSSGNWDNNKASLNVASGATVDTWDSPGGVTVDALTGQGTVTHTRYGAANSLTVGVNHGSGTFDGIVTNQSGYDLNLVKQGAGTQTLTGANTYTGTTTVSGGTLEFTDSSGLGFQNSALDTASSVAGDASSGLKIAATTLTTGGLIGDKDLASVFTTTSGGYDAVTALTLNAGAEKSHAYSGIIADGAAGMTLTKTGAGTQTLSGDNTYTGVTTINEGTLVVNGASASSAFIIGANGTLSGSGASSVALTVNGTLAGTGTYGATSVAGSLNPGNSPGTMTFTDDLTLLDTAMTNLEFEGTGAGQFDVLLGDGANTLAADGILTLITTSYVAVAGDTFLVFEDWDTFSGSFSSIIGTDLGDGLYFDTSMLLVDGTLNVVPEPSSYALFAGMLALSAMAVRRRRD